MAPEVKHPWKVSTIVALAAASFLSERLPRRSEETPPNTVAGSVKPAAVQPKAASGLQSRPREKFSFAVVFKIAKNVFARIGKDNLSLVAAGIAFYAMTAIFPAIAAFVSIYGLFADPTTIQQQIKSFSSLMPPESLKIITDALQSFAGKAHSSLNIALTVSVVLALWSAKAGVSSLMSGLNIANEVPEKRSFIKQQVVALGLTIGSVLLAMVAFAAIAIVPAVLQFVSMPDQIKVWVGFGRWPILAILVAFGLAVLYYLGPSVEHPKWRWISWGALIATALWLFGSLLFATYVSNFSSYDKTYGSIAAPVILLLWFWLSALIILIGEEIDAELQAADRHVVREPPRQAA